MIKIHSDLVISHHSSKVLNAMSQKKNPFSSPKVSEKLLKLSSCKINIFLKTTTAINKDSHLPASSLNQ